MIFKFEHSQKFIDWANKEKKRNLERPEPFRTHCEKYRGFVAKLALIFHLAQCELSKDAGIDGRRLDEDQQVIPDETLLMAIQFTEEYLLKHLPRVYGVADNYGVGAKEGIAFARAILDKREQTSKASSLNLSDVRRWQRANLKSPDDVRLAFRWLESHAWGSYIQAANSGGRRAERFEINPRVFENF